MTILLGERGMEAECPPGAERLSRADGPQPAKDGGGAWQAHVSTCEERREPGDIARLVDVEASWKEMRPQPPGLGARDGRGEDRGGAPRNVREERRRRSREPDQVVPPVVGRTEHDVRLASEDEGRL